MLSPLITHQQGQTGLSTVGVAHSLAVDWLGWICLFHLIFSFVIDIGGYRTRNNKYKQCTRKNNYAA